MRGAFDRLCTRRRAVEGRAAVWQIAKRRACVRRPLLSVGLIAHQRRGLVRWAAGQGMNQPPPPTGRTKAAHSLSVGTTAASDSKGAADASFRSGGDVCYIVQPCNSGGGDVDGAR